MNELILMDLEETIIDQWDSFIPIRIEPVQRFLSRYPLAQVGLFSWAVENQKDLQKFQTIRSMLRQTFNLEFDDEWLFTLEDIRKLVQRHTVFQCENIEEFICTWSKEFALLTMMKDSRFENLHVVVLDDMVRNMCVSLPDINSRVTFINATSLV